MNTETFSCENYSIKYLTIEETNKLIEERGYKSSNELKDTESSDLVPNVYEGGFKVWECSLDICSYLIKYSSTINFKNKRVLELGCGAGLPGIIASLLGATKICFQDFNESVLKCFTEENVKINGINNKYIEYVSGDWSLLSDSLEKSKNKYDIILTTETIYCEDNYEKLHNVFVNGLENSGNSVIFLGAKIHYFGVGGSVYTFMDFLENKGIFKSEIIYKTTTSIPRLILKITRK
uniref:protein-histidine N-methyltransferase n=1 Tax=Parastrongyloides trichosuri TaxID=131310 RepID=A0A0N4ZNW1_PARTI